MSVETHLKIHRSLETKIREAQFKISKLQNQAHNFSGVKSNMTVELQGKKRWNVYFSEWMNEEWMKNKIMNEKASKSHKNQYALGSRRDAFLWSSLAFSNGPSRSVNDTNSKTVSAPLLWNRGSSTTLWNEANITYAFVTRAIAILSIFKIKQN